MLTGMLTVGWIDVVAVHLQAETGQGEVADEARPAETRRVGRPVGEAGAVAGAVTGVVVLGRHPADRALPEGRHHAVEELVHDRVEARVLPVDLEDVAVLEDRLAELNR